MRHSLNPNATRIRWDMDQYVSFGRGLPRIVTVFVGLAMTSLASAAEFHVSPQGNDANEGSAAKPWATVQRAQQEVRQVRKNGPPTDGITVVVHAGTYEFDKTWELTAADSGTEQAPVVYRAAPREEVRFVGGKVIKGWVPVTDQAVLQRLDPGVRGKVMQADMQANGVTELGVVKPGPSWASSEPGLELFFNDAPLTLARYPNQGTIKVIAIGPTEKDVRGRKGRVEGVLRYEGDRPKRWVGEPDLMLHGFWFHDWADQRQKVESLDVKSQTLTLAKPYHNYGYRDNQWYYAYNVLAELDQPGEYYLDRKTGRMYLYPPSKVQDARTSVSVLPTLLSCKDVSYVTFQGIVFECVQKTAVTVSGGTQVRLAGCTIRNSGSWGANINGGTGHVVVGCDIYHNGDGGVHVSGGVRKTLTPGNHVIDNCHIHHYSRWNPVYKAGIRVDGVGNRVTHNLIHDAPHMAINFGGNDHLFEFNEMHSVVYETNDAGMMYAGQDFSGRGNVIRYNYLHHVYGRESRGCVGVYLDDNFSSATITGNLFVQVPKAAFIGGGRHTTIENNLFVDCAPAIHVDARGLGWRAYGREELTKKLEALPFQQEPWLSRYPELAKMLDFDPMAPVGNLITRNVAVGGKWADIEKKAEPYIAVQNNFLDVDPKFVNAKAGDYRLRPDSPVLQAGFKPLPLEKIGLYQDELRATWPVTHAVRPAPPKPVVAFPVPKPK